MARKKTTEAVPVSGAPSDGAAVEPLPPSDVNGTGDAGTGHEAPPQPNGEKRAPVFKCGPIPTDQNNSVEACVWANEITTRDSRTFTVYNVTCQANWRDSDGTWKSTKGFRSSMVPALVYCLNQCYNWVCSMRDPQQNAL